VGYFLFYFLGASAQEFNSSAPTFGANFGGFLFVVTLVTYQPPILAMIGEWKITSWTLKDKTTISALDKGGCASPVEKEDYLFPCFQSLSHVFL